MSGEVTELAVLTYELARSISILRSAHYQHCNGHDWSDKCPVFAAWDSRRPQVHVGAPVNLDSEEHS